MPKNSEKEDGSATDVTRQAELVVMDCLRSWNCPQALEAFMLKSSASQTMSIGTERFARGLERKTKSGGDRISLLEYLVTAGCENTSSGRSYERSPCVKTKEREGDTAVEWSKEEVSALKKAIKKTSAVEDRTERWKQIAELVGNSKSKKHCYIKYKELKQEQTNSAAKKASPSSASRRRPTTDTCESEAKKERSSTQSDEQPITQAGDEDPSIRASSTATDSSQPLLAVNESPLPAAPAFVAVSSRDLSASPASSELLEIEDCEDMSELVVQPPRREAPVNLTRNDATVSARSAAMLPTAASVTAVQQLLFGESKKTFNSHWEEQGFVFSTVRNLQYGLVQHQGGPCGVLAVVQGYVLRFLLQNAPTDWKNPGVPRQERALVQALTHILWQAARASQGQGSSSTECIFAIKENGSSSQRRFMAGVKLHITTSEEQTRQAIAVHLAQFMEAKGGGLVQFVLSVLLTKGVDSIKREMDQVGGDAGGQLIGAHDYCTQELVNLLLCGHASSNVFNGQQQLEGGSDQGSGAITLHGIPTQSVVGFLSLFEAYQYLVVGSHLKQPQFNVWVVCSESHYSVLFVADPQALEDRTVETRPRLDLLYFDGLANQDEEIRLSLSTFALEQETATASHEDLVPPLNLVIRTKWPRATVDWNGVEPLL